MLRQAQAAMPKEIFSEQSSSYSPDLVFCCPMGPVWRICDRNTAGYGYLKSTSRIVLTLHSGRRLSGLIRVHIFKRPAIHAVPDQYLALARMIGWTYDSLALHMLNE